MSLVSTNIYLIHNIYVDTWDKKNSTFKSLQDVILNIILNQIPNVYYFHFKIIILYNFIIYNIIKLQQYKFYLLQYLDILYAKKLI